MTRFRKLRTPSLLALGILSASAASASAQSRDSTSRDSTRRRLTNLNAVVVTATRSATANSKIPQKVDVITRADIEQSAATDVPDILKRLAAIDVVQYPSLLSGVGIRGFRPETGGLNRRTLVLVDGRPASASNMATLPLDNIERIEVLKGSASALYGSNAMGGTVHIITRKSSGDIRSTGAVTYGSFNTTDLAGRTGGAITPSLDFDAHLHEYRQRENYRIGSGGILRKWAGSKTATQLLSDGTKKEVNDKGDDELRSATAYNYQNGGARLGYTIGHGFRIDLSGDMFRARDVRVPGDIAQADTFNSRKNLERNSFDVALTGTHGAHETRLRAYTTLDQSDAYSDTTSARYINYKTDTKTQGVQLQDAIAFGAQSVTVGVDYFSGKTLTHRYSSTAEIGTYSPNSKSTSLAGFAQLAWSALDERLTGTLGGRLDHLTQDLLTTPFRPDVTAGKKTFTTFNPSAGVQYRVLPSLHAHGSVGRGFVTPDPFSMAGQAIAGPTANVVSYTTGNPNLSPETSISYDVGFGFAPSSSGFNADVTYFRTDVSNRITTVRANFAAPDQPTTSEGYQVSRVQTSVNANSARMHGLEVEGSYNFGALAGNRYVLRVFSNATRMFSAYERVRAASVNSAQFADSTNFKPTDVINAIVLGAETKSRIRNVAPMTFTTGVAFDDLQRFSGRLTARYVGKRLDTDFSDPMFPDILYAPFAVADVVLGMRVSPSSRVDVLVNNVTDENYYEKRGYPLPGRSLQLRLSFER